jgi:D-hexose-6-phosphate mutarotase
MTLDTLNQQFGIADHIQFHTGTGDLPMVQIDNALGAATICLQGGHVTAFRPRGADEVLWLSPCARFQAGKAIRGGVPVIWPWFGPHPTDVGKPQHGFARLSRWQVLETEARDDGASRLRLQRMNDAETRALWSYPFQLILDINVGTELDIALHCRNIGAEAFDMGAALHSYFAVSDISRTHITGLAGRQYIDQIDGNRIKSQQGELRIDEEVDRIYIDTDTENVCMIHDAQRARRIRVIGRGSRSTVVWNPWAAKALAMSDFPNDGYRTMVCIEAANAAADIRRLAPGETHILAQTISVET